MSPLSEKEYARMHFEADRNPGQVQYDDMVERKIVNIISQLNPDNLLSDIEHRLRGYKKDYFTEQWEKLKGYKPISEVLVSRFISFLGAILNDNTRFSNYSVDEINNIMFQIIEFIRDDLTDNDELYGLSNSKEVVETVEAEVLIKDDEGIYSVITAPMRQVIRVETEGADYNEMTRIGHIICVNVFSVLKRALNGTESRRIFDALKMSENLNQNEKKHGILDAIQFWK